LALKFFWRQNIGEKVLNKMLMKLTPEKKLLKILFAVLYVEKKKYFRLMSHKIFLHTILRLKKYFYKKIFFSSKY